MPSQNYNNHVRYYIPHHLVFYSLIGILFFISVYGICRYPQERLLWGIAGCLDLLLGFLSFMLRQHYALMLQNRVVKLELRFRYYVLTQKSFDIVEAQLSDGQIYALRFAPDNELPALAERAAKEGLSADAIKRAIRNWLPDRMRV